MKNFSICNVLTLSPTVYIFSMLVTTLVSLMLSVEANATIYRWVDADGKPILSDRKPPHGNYQEINQDELPLVNITPEYTIKPTAGQKKPAKNIKNSNITQKKKLSCRKYERKLALIQEKLKSGYKEPAGNKLRAKRRDYKNLLINCRKNQ